MVRAVESVDRSVAQQAGEADGLHQARVNPQYFGDLKAVDRLARSAWEAVGTKQAVLDWTEYKAEFIFAYEDTLLTVRLRAEKKNSMRRG